MRDRHSSKGQTAGPIGQHKRMAEGEKITGMKKGGITKKACGGIMKKGGMPKKKKK